MERRKFLIGAGSLAAGSAAAMGTGAFTSVEANRDVSIGVTGDASAYLRITREDTPNGNEYVENTSDGIALNFDSVNTQADSKFSNLLRVQNEGTQIVRVGVDHEASDLPAGFGVFAEGPLNDGSLLPKQNVQPHSGDNPGSSLVDSDGDGNTNYKVSSGSYSSPPSNSTIATGAGFDFWDDPVDLEVGEAVENIGVAWDANDVDFDELDGSHSIVIRAAAVDDGQSIEWAEDR
jgi:hypothetical protein